MYVFSSVSTGIPEKTRNKPASNERDETMRSLEEMLTDNNLKDPEDIDALVELAEITDQLIRGEGYPEIGLYWEKAAWEEAEHAAKFAELLGEVVTDSTKKNLEMRVEAEYGATAGKTDLAKRAKELGLDAIHDTVHEMARDEARHGKALKGLLERYFK